MNRALIRLILKKTPYELYKGRKPNISHFRIFDCRCFVLNNGKDNLGKFDAKSDEGIFLGYSLHSKAYRVYNKRTITIEESIHVVFYETNPFGPRKDVVDDVIEILENTHLNAKEKEPKTKEESEKEVHIKRNQVQAIFQRNREPQDTILLTTLLVMYQKG